MNYYDKIVKINVGEVKNIDSKVVVKFEEPKVCGYFSIDKDRNYISSTTNLLYYYPRFNEHIKLNLNSGIDRVVPKPDNLNEKLDHMLQFIINNKQLLKANENRLLDTDFICFRGLLTKVMCALDLKDELTVCAIKWKGTIYLCEYDKKEVYNIPEVEMKKFSSWGYKFEQYMLTDKLGIPPDTSKPVYEAEEFCCMFTSKLGCHKLMYGAEMDGVLASSEIDKENPDFTKLQFIELKTSKETHHPGEERTLKMFKFIKWWNQCFLVNIKEVHCGFRDKYGFVRKIVPYNVKKLPQMSSDYWNWKTCLNFCNIFLNILKDVIPEDTDDPHSVWKFEWKPDCKHFVYSTVSGVSPYSFLPSWYIDNITKKE